MDKNRKKRVLFIVPLPPPVHGSTVMCQYIKDSELINGHFNCDYVNLSASRSTKEVHKFQLVKIWRVLFIWFIVFGKLLIKHYDLCYVALAFHGSLLKDAPVVILCKLFRRKVVVHLHGKGASDDANNRIYNWLLKKTFKKTKVILLSWLLYPDVEEFVKKEDVMICPNGIPIVEHMPRKKENIIPRLLFLSNLIESKGVVVLLDALKILKDKGYSFICEFVGGETVEIDAVRFQKEVEMRGLNELAIYSGRKYGGDKEESFIQADVFVLPTMNDCFPLVLLEAMNYAKPVVTTAIGGIPDIVDDYKTGLLSDAGDINSLALCLETLLKNKALLSQFGKGGQKKFYEHFSQDTFETCLKNTLKTAMGGGQDLIFVDILEKYTTTIKIGYSVNLIYSFFQPITRMSVSRLSFWKLCSMGFLSLQPMRVQSVILLETVKEDV